MLHVILRPNFLILKIEGMLYSYCRLAHAITPCEDLPNFETLLASFETSMSIKGNPETIPEDESNAIKVEPPKPPERRRRKLPEIPKIYLQQSINFMSRQKAFSSSLYFLVYRTEFN